MSVSYITGDIGGTNARLLLIEIDPKGFERKLDEQTYPSGDYSSLDVIIRAFLQKNGNCKPYACCLAAAGPVNKLSNGDQTVTFSNLSWKVSAFDLSAQVGIEKVSIINDFVAVGYGITELKGEDVVVINKGQVEAGGPIACLGAGTGLGEVYCTFNGREYDVWGTEGGHTDFAPRNKREYQLMEFLKQFHDIPRISVERVVSGSAIPLLYEFLKPQYKESKAVVNAMSSNLEKKAAVISKYAMKDSSERDRLCFETMKLFLDNYAAEAGDLALKTLCKGGLFIAGGIAPKIIPLLQDPQFMEILCSKGRMSVILKTIPVHVIVNPSVGMMGAQVVARRSLRDDNIVSMPIVPLQCIVEGGKEKPDCRVSERVVKVIERETVKKTWVRDVGLIGGGVVCGVLACVVVRFGLRRIGR